MTKLSDTQLIILSAAAKRDDRIALPLPSKLKGGAAAKVVASLIAKGLIQEVQARRNGLQDGDPVWRESEDGHATTLIITAAGLAAIGIDTVEAAEALKRQAPQRATVADTGATAATADDDASTADNAPTAQAGAKVRTPRTPREGTKQAILIEMLRAKDGATISEIAAATSWLPHTIRGAMSGALKKKLGLTVTSEKDQQRGRVYKLPPA